MFQLKHLCVLLILPFIFSEVASSRRKCGKYAHYVINKCVCNKGCIGDPYAYGPKGCHYVKPLGPSYGQVKRFNSGVNSHVNSILNQDHRIQAGETSEINRGVRNDMRNVYLGNRKTNLRGDIRNLNIQAHAAQKQGRRHNYGAAAGLGRCGPFAHYAGGKCICNPGCYRNSYNKCVRKCGKFTYRRGKRCYCKRGFKGDPYKLCFRLCGLNAYSKGGKCFCNKSYSGNPRRICLLRRKKIVY